MAKAVDDGSIKCFNLHGGSGRWRSGSEQLDS
jgi:hypothetical protein